MNKAHYKIKYGGRDGKQFCVAFIAANIEIVAKLQQYDTRALAIRGINDLKKNIKNAVLVNQVPDNRRQDPLMLAKMLKQPKHTPVFIIKPGGPGMREFVVTFKAGNYQKQFNTESYRSMQGAKAAITAVRRDAVNAPVVDETKKAV